MALNNEVRQAVLQQLERYEGRKNFFYLDSLGHVTVGVGHLVASRDLAAALPLLKNAHGSAATPEEKRAEFDQVVRQPRGHLADWYQTQVPTTLHLAEAGIDTLLAEQVTQFYQELRNIYQAAHGYADDFDNYPPNVQAALFDMIFNLGAQKIVQVFKKFDAAIRAGDWQTAAAESNRPQLAAERNQYVRDLLLSTTA
jgi:GH24 family phage-related lysozyme (muramidase)